MINQVTIGADPELFLVNGAKTNKPVVSAIGIIPGEKGIQKPSWSKETEEDKIYNSGKETI